MRFSFKPSIALSVELHPHHVAAPTLTCFVDPDKEETLWATRQLCSPVPRLVSRSSV
ncbi:protein of unknown function [Kyrpidia spormannii]|uniref:Uncharacterized protein n=2 Tax=Kyrpidia spormannii TaxID=2055160 RepID=A0ACA8ZBJ7_9BACL|nr:protein of unknown function [Kyrpidia spormannii]CAB3394729.1 protein of unknown function [Kyrpidia spormannii]